MPLKFAVTIILTVLTVFLSAQSIQPIGLWREHLPYNSAIDVAAANDRVYCATPYSLFSVTIADKSIERFSRITGLSETGISRIFFDATNEKLVIAYANSNVDIVYRNDIINVPDIKRDNLIGDKSIYDIFSLGKNYFLSTGLGIIVIDGEKYEIKDSWFIGSGGAHTKVNGFTSMTGFYFAATEEGLKRAPTSSNPADPGNWQLLSGAGGLNPGTCQDVMVLNNRVVVQKDDSLFIQDGSNWSLLYHDGWILQNVEVSEGRLNLCERKPNGESRVIILNNDATVRAVFSQPGVISFPRKAVSMGADIWLADQFGGLSLINANGFEQFEPNSPEATASGELTVANNTFYATAGEVNAAWNYQYNGNGIFILKDGIWNNINRYRYPQLDTLLDYIAIAADPEDRSVWAASFGGGLLHIKSDQTFEIFKQGKLGEAVGDPGSYRVSGLAFDRAHHLWISNYGAPQPLIVKKKDGDWQRFTVPFSLAENALAQILVDGNDYKWVVAPKAGGLICFDDGQSIDNSGDDRWKMFRPGIGNGNLPDGDIICIAKDKNDFVWVGTGNGIGVIQCGSEAFSQQPCEAIWPIVKQGNFAGYLFSGEEVRSIAVDGADRKWVATKNGVWLVSATGEKVIHQFTEANSPLLSDDVRKIAIDGISGEVFFATSKGICSFRGTATEGGDDNKNLLVFPNPVPPAYNGTIAIRGLVNNAIVKIVELDGRLVYQTRALGGQAIWDGKNYKGQRISSGVYLILIKEDDGNEGRSEKAAGKIVFIAK